MFIFKKVAHLQTHLDFLKKQGKTIGFVPTMGALHQGHLTLISKAKTQNDIAVCSIFVNPTQFNVAADLDKYPRTAPKDIALLHDAACDILFFPSVDEIYPKDTDLTVPMDFGTLKDYMEGPYRPGHFEGVVQVVKRLLDIVLPHRIYMGQKDFQQWRIIQRMVDQYDLAVEVVGVPIVRAKDGLALSSRNLRLSEKGRALAPTICHILQAAKKELERLPVEVVKNNAIQRFEEQPNFTLDYFEIVDGNTLVPITDAAQHDFIVACTAAFLEEVRLIDNMILKP